MFWEGVCFWFTQPNLASVSGSWIFCQTKPSMNLLSNQAKHAKKLLLDLAGLSRNRCFWIWHNSLAKDSCHEVWDKVSGSWIFCQTKLSMPNWHAWLGLVLESSVKPSQACQTKLVCWLGLTEDSRTTDLWLGLLVLILIRMTRLRQLWAYLRDWFQSVKN